MNTFTQYFREDEEEPTEEDLISKRGYDPKRAGDTQRPGTVPTYEKIYKTFATEYDTILDYSSGLGVGTKLGLDRGFNVESFEPYYSPNKKGSVHPPDYTKEDEIPEDHYDLVINCHALNVVARDVRVKILNRIYKSLKSGGTAVIVTRDVRSVMDGVSDDQRTTGSSRMTSRGTFQKGFTSEELRSFVASVLPDAQVETERIGSSNSTVVVRKP